jgi:hypothetical protein
MLWKPPEILTSDCIKKGCGMSLQHDVKRYEEEAQKWMDANGYFHCNQVLYHRTSLPCPKDIEYGSAAQMLAVFAETVRGEGGEWEKRHNEAVMDLSNRLDTAETELAAVRGEVERLTAAFCAKCSETILAGGKYAEGACVHCTGERHAQEVRQLINFRMQDAKIVSDCVARAETAEASLRSLRDATLEEAAKIADDYRAEAEGNVREFRKLRLSIAGDAVEHVVAAHTIAESIRKLKALTPAAPDSTKSTESTAARKSNDWTTPTTDAARNAKDHGGLMTNAQITSYGAGTDDWHIDIRPKKSGPLVCSACGR